MLAFLTLFIAGVAADCSRSFLKSATDAYLSAQTAGKPSSLSSFLSSNLTYTENGKAFDIKNSTLAIPIKSDYTFSAHDTAQCASFTEIVAANNPHPYVIHTRIVYAAAKATLIESIVTDEGDWLFNATGTLDLIQHGDNGTGLEDWTRIATAKQDSRAALQAVGDAYFDRFGNASVYVPWGPPCYRIEGGLDARGTLNGSYCEQAYPSTIHVPYRRYVVDEEVGVVDMFIGFPGLDRTQGQIPMPDSHLFRVEGGRIKYLHTASECVVAGCGENNDTLSARGRYSVQWKRALISGS
ncbi:hypothetical protein EJ04DRAFT_593181 [Polyplosphaeria fusca]|uniref:DUF8021 domain-containing protein n=1 Tax=Polyplosphaeria fusca TaxID=682080 RepID=A0A9P4UVC7_9PLEO|nr:hypothetical protein EJ04DRAFT_593181 [Polyplosphaeria fusca]